jgi:hypothetical protein
MPLFPRRRRHHSWPYCIPGHHTTNHARIKDLGISKLRASKEPFSSWTSSPYVLSSLDSRHQDDDLSAGIVRSRSVRHGIWPSSCCDDDDDERSEELVSSITEAGELPSAVLRTIVPHINLVKVRLFPVHQTTTDREERVLISYFGPFDFTDDIESRAMGAGESADRSAGHLRPREGARRMHRRRHSEQPRSWREPSVELWTLLEE